MVLGGQQIPQLGLVEARTILVEAVRRTVEWEQAHPNEDLGDEAFDYAAEDAALQAAGS